MPLYIVYYALFIIIIIVVIIALICERLNQLKCPDCGRRMTEGPHQYIYKGIDFGVFAAESCVHCNTVYFTEESSKRIEEKAKKLGL